MVTRFMGGLRDLWEFTRFMGGFTRFMGVCEIYGSYEIYGAYSCQRPDCTCTERPDVWCDPRLNFRTFHPGLKMRGKFSHGSLRYCGDRVARKIYESYKKILTLIDLELAI